MKEIAFIDGKTKIRIKNNNLSSYLERIESAGYLLKANKCKGKEGWRDVLMIGRARDFEEFFSRKVAINKLLNSFHRYIAFFLTMGKSYCICSRIVRLFNTSTI